MRMILNLDLLLPLHSSITIELPNIGHGRGVQGARIADHEWRTDYTTLV